MAWKSDVVVRLNKDAIKKELILPIMVQYVKSAQRIVATAKKNHPYTDQTGNNTRRIGWAASGPDQTGFGPLTTAVGKTSSEGSGKTSPRGEPSVIVATSSGYGGYLEVGTRRMKKTTGPYVYPAYEADQPELKRALTKIA